MTRSIVDPTLLIHTEPAFPIKMGNRTAFEDFERKQNLEENYRLKQRLFRRSKNSNLSFGQIAENPVAKAQVRIAIYAYLEFLNKGYRVKAS